jgi:hypothetical protein
MLLQAQRAVTAGRKGRMTGSDRRCILAWPLTIARSLAGAGYGAVGLTGLGGASGRLCVSRSTSSVLCGGAVLVSEALVVAFAARGARQV